MRRVAAEKRDQKASNQTDAKKYVPGLDPLEKESSIMNIQPLGKVQADKMMKLVNRFIKEGGLSAAEKKAFYFWKANLVVENAEGVIHQEFMRDFWAWLLGRGKEIDHKKSPWYRQSLCNDVEVSAYVDSFVTKRHEFQLKLKLLAMRHPKGINQHYLYFKYVVRGEPPNSDHFLDDWGLFLDEFTEARAGGQKERNRDEIGDEYQGENAFHEMAPYGADRAIMARHSDARKVEKMIEGATRSWNDDDLEENGEASAKPPPRSPPGQPKKVDDKPKGSVVPVTVEEQIVAENLEFPDPPDLPSAPTRESKWPEEKDTDDLEKARKERQEEAAKYQEETRRMFREMSEFQAKLAEHSYNKTMDAFAELDRRENVRKMDAELAEAQKQLDKMQGRIQAEEAAKVVDEADKKQAERLQKMISEISEEQKNAKIRQEESEKRVVEMIRSRDEIMQKEIATLKESKNRSVELERISKTLGDMQAEMRLLNSRDIDKEIKATMAAEYEKQSVAFHSAIKEAVLKEREANVEEYKTLMQSREAFLQAAITKASLESEEKVKEVEKSLAEQRLRDKESVFNAVREMNVENTEKVRDELMNAVSDKMNGFDAQKLMHDMNNLNVNMHSFGTHFQNLNAVSQSSARAVDNFQSQLNEIRQTNEREKQLLAEAVSRTSKQAVEVANLEDRLKQQTALINSYQAKNLADAASFEERVKSGIQEQLAEQQRVLQTYQNQQEKQAKQFFQRARDSERKMDKMLKTRVKESRRNVAITVEKVQEQIASAPVLQGRIEQQEVPQGRLEEAQEPQVQEVEAENPVAEAVAVAAEPNPNDRKRPRDQEVPVPPKIEYIGEYLKNLAAWAAEPLQGIFAQQPALQALQTRVQKDVEILEKLPEKETVPSQTEAAKEVQITERFEAMSNLEKDLELFESQLDNQMEIEQSETEEQEKVAVKEKVKVARARISAEKRALMEAQKITEGVDGKRVTEKVSYKNMAGPERGPTTPVNQMRALQSGRMGGNVAGRNFSGKIARVSGQTAEEKKVYNTRLGSFLRETDKMMAEERNVKAKVVEESTEETYDMEQEEELYDNWDRQLRVEENLDQLAEDIAGCGILVDLDLKDECSRDPDDRFSDRNYAARLRRALNMIRTRRGLESRGEGEMEMEEEREKLQLEGLFNAN